jgi:hypothetical protein
MIVKKLCNDPSLVDYALGEAETETPEERLKWLSETCYLEHGVECHSEQEAQRILSGCLASGQWGISGLVRILVRSVRTIRYAIKDLGIETKRVTIEGIQGTHTIVDYKGLVALGKHFNQRETYAKGLSPVAYAHGRLLRERDGQISELGYGESLLGNQKVLQPGGKPTGLVRQTP